MCFYGLNSLFTHQSFKLINKFLHSHRMIVQKWDIMAIFISLILGIFCVGLVNFIMSIFILSILLWLFYDLFLVLRRLILLCFLWLGCFFYCGFLFFFALSML